MKARNPSTGNLETVYVKALDSMPVGTEVDFDGSVADIPTGWEQVSDTAKVLWTNSNPTSNFGEVAITIDDLSEYDVIGVWWKDTTGSSRPITETKFIKTAGGQIFYTTTSSSSGNPALAYQRQIVYTNDTTLTVQKARRENVAYYENYIIPMYIVGYKTGLF